MQNALKYDWQQDIEPYLDTRQDVVGGFTPAERGVITLADGAKVFIKMATDENTAKWIGKEIRTYRKLTEVGYEYMPLLLAVRDDQKAFAIEYLEGASFENDWDKDKLEAVVRAQTALKDITESFVGDPDYKSGDVVDTEPRWPQLLEADNLERVNQKLSKLGASSRFTKEQIEDFARLHIGWSVKEDTLVHEDIRADNFGYNPVTKQGKLVDWNWICVGDASLDTTPLFINMYKGDFNAYQYHPEKYDKLMIIYLIGFWLASVLGGNEDSSERELRLRTAQAESIDICVELLSRQ